MVFHVDRGRILQHQFTPEGFLRAYMRIGRVGELKYYNLDGTERIEVVTPEVLFHKDSIDSFKMKPITLGHPSEGKVTAKNFRKYGRGLTGHTAIIDGDFLGLVSTIADEETIDAITSGRADQTSCGYDAPIRQRNDGKYEQTQRLGNHVAAVPQGRAGSDVGIHLDSIEECWLQVRCDDDREVDESQIKQLLSSDGIVDRLLNLDEFDRTIQIHISKKDEGIPASNSDQRKQSMTIISLGNRTYKIDGDDAPKLADAIADYQTKQDAALTTAQTEATAEKKRADTAEGKLEVLTSEKAQLQQKLDSAESQRMDADQVSSEIKSRLDAWKLVLPLMRSDSADYEPDYNLSVSDIQKLAIAKKLPDVKLDGKSEDTIAGMWEAIVPSLQQTTERADSSQDLFELVTIAQRNDSYSGKKTNPIAERRKERSKQGV